MADILNMALGPVSASQANVGSPTLPHPSGSQAPQRSGRLAPVIRAVSTFIRKPVTTLGYKLSPLLPFIADARISPSEPKWMIGAELILGAMAYLTPILRAPNALWEIIAGRQARSAAPPPDTRPQQLSLARRIYLGLNDLDGQKERYLTPWRGIAATAALVHGFFSSHSAGPAIVAVGLSLWNFVEMTINVYAPHVGNQVRKGDILTPNAWVRHEVRSSGFSALPVPSAFPEEDYVGDRPVQYAEGVTPRWSLSSNFASLFQMIRMLPMAMAVRARVDGIRVVFKDWGLAILKKRMALVSTTAMPYANVFLRAYHHFFARNARMSAEEDVSLLDTIPTDKPVIRSEWPHVEVLFYQTWLSAALARLGAAKENFYDNLFMRLSGLGPFLSSIGIFFLERGSKKSADEKEATYKRMVDSMLEHKTQPIVQAQGTRAPRSYKRNGEPSRPSTFSAIQKNSEHPERYCNLNGTIEMALAVADQVGEAYIAVQVRTFVDAISGKPGPGTHPKNVSPPPFIGPHRLGQKATLKVVKLIKVLRGDDHENIERQIAAAAKEGSGDVPHLQGIVTEMGDYHDRPIAATYFATLAEKDERFYVLASRIEAIHPELRQREASERRLLDILDKAHRNEAGWQTELHETLKAVTKVVKRTEYWSLIRLRIEKYLRRI